MNKITRIFIGIVLMGCLPAYGKGGNEHFQDMLDVFPFAPNALGNNKVLDFYESLHSFIDEPNWISKERHKPNCIIKDAIFSQIKFGDGNHRIWFHWGLCEIFPIFKSQAEKSNTLQKYIDDHYGLSYLSQEDRHRFWYELKNEEYERIQEIRRKAPIAFGYSNEEYIKQIWAFVHVLYDIHMLGDHTTTEYDLVLPEDRIREDLFHSIEILGGTENSELSANFISFLKQSSPFVQANPGTKYGSAQKLLNAMKDSQNGFAHFILSCKGAYSYKMRFEDAGMVIKQVYSKQKAA